MNIDEFLNEKSEKKLGELTINEWLQLKQLIGGAIIDVPNKNEIIDLKNRCKEELIHRAIEQQLGGIKNLDEIDELTIRELLTIDMKDDLPARQNKPTTKWMFTTPEWKVTLIKGWNTIEFHLEEKKIIIIYGIIIPSSPSNITTLQFNVGIGGCKHKQIWNVQGKNYMIINEPVIYDKYDFCNIKIYSRNNKTEDMILLGYIIQKEERET